MKKFQDMKPALQTLILFTSFLLKTGTSAVIPSQSILSQSNFKGETAFKNFFNSSVYEFTQENADRLTVFIQKKKEREENYKGIINFSPETLLFKHYDEIFLDMTGQEKDKIKASKEQCGTIGALFGCRVPGTFRYDSNDEELNLEDYKQIPFTSAEFFDNGTATLVMDTREIDLKNGFGKGVKTRFQSKRNSYIQGHGNDNGYWHVVYTYNIKLSEDKKVMKEYKIRVCIPDYINKKGEKVDCHDFYSSDKILDYPYTGNQSEKCKQVGYEFSTEEIIECFINPDWLDTKEIYVINDKKSKYLLENGDLIGYNEDGSSKNQSAASSPSQGKGTSIGEKLKSVAKISLELGMNYTMKSGCSKFPSLWPKHYC